MKEKQALSSIERSLFENHQKRTKGFPLKRWAMELRANPMGTLNIESVPINQDGTVVKKYAVLSKVPIIEVSCKDITFYPEPEMFGEFYLYEFTTKSKVTVLKSEDREFRPSN
jgi:hypothetical protein